MLWGFTGLAAKPQGCILLFNILALCLLVCLCVCTMGLWINDTVLDLYFEAACINKTFTVNHIFGYLSSWPFFWDADYHPLCVCTLISAADSEYFGVVLWNVIFFFFWMFFGGPFFFRHGPSNIFDFTAVAAAETDSQSQKKKKKKKGNRERMRLGDGRRSQWLCHLHLNRISHRHRQEGSPQKRCWRLIYDSLWQPEEPASTADWNSAMLMFCSQLNVVCLLLVA